MSGCIRLLLIFSALLFAATNAAAQGEGAEFSEVAGDGWLSSAQYHGFISQGYIQTDHNNFFGDSESGSFDFTELGANISVSPTSNLRVSAQLNYRRAGENSAKNIGLDYGFVDYRFIDELEGTIGLRLGRIKNPYGFYNETRDVAATRPSVLLPQSIYSDPLRDVWHSADSIGGYYYGSFANLEIKFDGVYGHSDAIGDTVSRVKLPGYNARLDNRYISLGRMSLGSDVGSWKLAYTFGKTALRFSTREPVRLQGGEIREAINLLSGEYLLEQWIFTAEYQKIESWSRADGVPAVLGFSESWYAQTAWLFHPKWRALLRYDHYVPDTDQDENYTGDTTAGLRYDYDNHWMAAIEYHHVKGSGWLTPADNPDMDAIEGNWNMLAAVVSYRF
jgi:hypothetical protein